VIIHQNGQILLHLRIVNKMKKIGWMIAQQKLPQNSWLSNNICLFCMSFTNM